ncbi:unnamed protein product [Arabidopsis thaliana]|uniref:Transmembrane protein n=1 Tax=Arabidopsis thaliana TaxID=3702 RepID=A0A654EB46_ARATH|nr:unnamed protein product [Arabidopsis thaliana]
MIKALHCTFFFVSTVLRFVLQELNMSIHLYCVLRLSRSFSHQGLLRGAIKRDYSCCCGRWRSQSR